MISKKEFEKSYIELSEPIFRHCYFRIFNREKAKELMQETFMKTWEYNLNGSKIDNLRAFLYRVAYNLTINEIKKFENKNTSLEEMQETINFEPEEPNANNAEINAEVSLLMRKLAQLEKPDAEVLTLRYVDDLSVKEIAQVLGITESAASVRIHRATDRLKKQYE